MERGSLQIHQSHHGFVASLRTWKTTLRVKPPELSVSTRKADDIQFQARTLQVLFRFSESANHQLQGCLFLKLRHSRLREDRVRQISRILQPFAEQRAFAQHTEPLQHTEPAELREHADLLEDPDLVVC